MVMQILKWRNIKSKVWQQLKMYLKSILSCIDLVQSFMLCVFSIHCIFKRTISQVVLKKMTENISVIYNLLCCSRKTITTIYHCCMFTSTVDYFSLAVDDWCPKAFEVAFFGWMFLSFHNYVLLSDGFHLSDLFFFSSISPYVAWGSIFCFNQ